MVVVEHYEVKKYSLVYIFRISEEDIEFVAMVCSDIESISFICCWL